MLLFCLETVHCLLVWGTDTLSVFLNILLHHGTSTSGSLRRLTADFFCCHNGWKKAFIKLKEINRDNMYTTSAFMLTLQMSFLYLLQCKEMIHYFQTLCERFHGCCLWFSQLVKNVPRSVMQDISYNTQNSATESSTG